MGNLRVRVRPQAFRSNSAPVSVACVNRTMTLRAIILKVHLYLGLTAALFLILLGLTGSIMAFEGDIDHWLHPHDWYVEPSNHPLSEADLIAKVEQQVSPARVGLIQIAPERNLAQAMQLSDRSMLTVNPYDGAILSRATGPNRTQKLLGQIHQLHLRMAPEPRGTWVKLGKQIISWAGLLLCMLAPTGFILWWRTRRASIRWKQSSWFRRCFDAHQVIGLYAGLFLWIAAFTGILIGFDWGEAAIYKLSGSAGPSRSAPPASIAMPGPTHISVDRAMEIARQAIPAGIVEMVQLPRGPKGAFFFVLRVPEETTGSPHSTVAVDQYSGQVLQARDFRTDSRGFYWIRFNRAIHTGDLFGTTGHVITSVSSLILVVMVLTGVVIWLKKLAV
jgi:uncharacterized iron-regulated membrane protein